MSYVLTFVASKSAYPPSENHVRQACNTLRQQNIEQTCEPIWLSEGKALDIGITKKPNLELMHNLQKMLYPDAIDIFISAIEGRRKKLLLADMDSTIVKGETLDELADFAGLKDKISAITAKAMEGELDFEAALRERVALLKNLPENALEKTLSEIEINPGAKTLVQTMRKHSAYCALVSGGFTFFTENIANKIGFDIDHGNSLEIKNETLTGQVIGPILDKYAKVNFLRSHAKTLKIKPDDTMTIGDGANDVPMLELAGFGVGYKPKKIVTQTIQNIIIHGDLSAALYAQGYTDQDIQK